MHDHLLYACIFSIAFLYATVGHGGASGYLALLALLNAEVHLMKSTALSLNILVSLIAFVQYYRSGYFRWRIFLPLALFSIPFSYLGGLYSINPNPYKIILGLCLLLASARLFLETGGRNEQTRNMHYGIAFPAGGGIGFISGLIGIGGGIILSPLLMFARWATAKETAAVSSLFILVNSIAGLSAQFGKGIDLPASFVFFVLSAFAGGVSGSYFGSRKYQARHIKIVLGFVLLIAGIKLIFF